MPRHRAVVFLLLFLPSAAAVLSCGSRNSGLPRLGVRGQPRYGATLFLQVTVSERANQNHPVALDLLLVYDDALLKELTAMSAVDWFEKRDLLRRDRGDAFDSWAWEWVPGQAVPLQAVPLPARPGAGMIFARYRSPGAHRIAVDPHGNIRIRLLEKEVVVEALK